MGKLGRSQRLRGRGHFGAVCALACLLALSACGKTDADSAVVEPSTTQEITPPLSGEAPVLDLTAQADIQTQITRLLAAQDNAWNRGDIAGFMEVYWDHGDLRFASGGAINRGWQATMDGYQARYPDETAMGELSFSNLEIKVLSPHYAQVFGRWGLKRDKDTPGGLFTLLFQKIDGQWKIISDHTSSE